MPIMDGFEACKFIIDSYKRFELNNIIYGKHENHQSYSANNFKSIVVKPLKRLD